MSDGTMEAPHSIMVYLNNEEVPAGNITQVTPHTIQLRLPAPVQSGDYDREVFWEAYMGGEQNSSSLRGSRRDAFNVAEPLTEVRVQIEGGLDGEMVPIPGYLRVRRDGTNSRRVVPTDSNGVATFGVPGTQLGVYFIEAMDELDDDAVGDWHNSTEQPYLIGEGGLETSIPLAKAAVLPPDNGYNDDALAFAIDLLGGVTYLAKGHLNVYINPGDRPSEADLNRGIEGILSWGERHVTLVDDPNQADVTIQYQETGTDIFDQVTQTFLVSNLFTGESARNVLAHSIGHALNLFHARGNIREACMWSSPTCIEGGPIEAESVYLDTFRTINEHGALGQLPVIEQHWRNN